ncbi:TonB-dependent receptor plug domain-containing protein [Acanthopleuribacter pedis]|uniref:TonB-dependent receptor plug domain-containing protein n=1 Tax=Acanthopleuribacter pedis TaxID=442870 RepID=A0A8J7Q707_9BACT|nr:TonB-dependent receptor plug domain-containing protein [Acanthopleuribacter pedis]MBO1317944.1 TonB-dependent receptor plug domain-containing protein [Acanthopleuribacter pedis]
MSFFLLTLLLLESALEADKFLDMSLEQLLDIEVTLASGVKETLREAPAAMIVITAEDIRKRGYTSLDEIFPDLPGFDTIISNGTEYMTAYQRGYRTPFMQRTLLMINGKVDNNLWSHSAQITRQYPVANIKAIEVLYGPASAVYGPNAFLGIVNVVTFDGRDRDDFNADIHFQIGQHQTTSVDALVTGKVGEIAYALSGRVYQSDEADLSGRFGFSDASLLANRETWGPILDFQVNGEQLGGYHNPTDDYGMEARVHYKNMELGYREWEKVEAYGPYYAFDRAQNNANWGADVSELYLDIGHDLNDRMNTKISLRLREDSIFGDWIEATPDWNPGMENFSYVSFTNWRSVNDSFLFKQNLDAEINDSVRLSTGIKYERKDLTRNYDIPGYWDAYSSTIPNTTPGPHGQGAGIFHSTDETYIRPQHPSGPMPADNRFQMEDYGGFLQAIIDRNAWRFNLGIRYDENSEYGSSVNPRVSVVRDSDFGTWKFMAGTAFQEPAPLQLGGGWNGRQANPDLEPEEVTNYEIQYLRAGAVWNHDFSIYFAQYESVIKEEAENAGERDSFGIEYKARFALPLEINSQPIEGYFNATYADVTSSLTYDHETGAWETVESELGDIADIKANLGFNLPFSRYGSLFVRANYVGERTLYSRNPLRDRVQTASHVVVNTNLIFSYKQFEIALKVKNLFDKDYFHPGVEGASSGDNFTQRSLGFPNSLLPQDRRRWFVTLTTRL